MNFVQFAKDTLWLIACAMLGAVCVVFLSGCSPDDCLVEGFCGHHADAPEQHAPQKHTFTPEETR